MIEKSIETRNQYGASKAWIAYQEVFASVGFLTDTVKDENQAEHNVTVQWVVRTRSKLNINREIRNFRIKARTREGKLVLYPLTFPLYDNGEWRVECSQEQRED